MTVTLILTRHGETADNASSVFQGQAGKGLNARGRAQAARLAERLRLAPPDAIVSSDLERAVETARIVSGACGCEPTFDRDLREVDVGLWTGKSHHTIAELYPEEWAAWSAGLDVRRGGGETYAELAERVERAILRIVAAHSAPNGDDRRILVVSHGGAIRSWVARLLGVEGGGLRVLAGVGNTALSIVLRDTRGRSRLESWNDRAHLEGLVVGEESD